MSCYELGDPALFEKIKYILLAAFLVCTLAYFSLEYYRISLGKVNGFEKKHGKLGVKDFRVGWW